jgi:hypothetical protein
MGKGLAKKPRTTRQAPEKGALPFQIQIHTAQAHTGLQSGLKLQST